jgi:hypothetical protein
MIEICSVFSVAKHADRSKLRIVRCTLCSERIRDLILCPFISVAEVVASEFGLGFR